MGGRCQPYKTNFFQSLPKLPFHTPPLPPIRATCTNFLDVKNDVLMIMTMVEVIIVIIILVLLMIL